MNFTDPMPFKCAEYSNSGIFLSISHGRTLTIYDSDTFETQQTHIFADMITSVHWSPDDDFIMIYLAKTQEVHLRCFNSSVLESKND